MTLDVGGGGRRVEMRHLASLSFHDAVLYRADGHGFVLDIAAIPELKVVFLLPDNLFASELRYVIVGRAEGTPVATAHLGARVSTLHSLIQDAKHRNRITARLAVNAKHATSLPWRVTACSATRPPPLTRCEDRANRGNVLETRGEADET